MNDKLRLWLEKEMSEMASEIQKLNKKLMKKVPIWMGISVGVMVGIGLLAGYDFLYILKVHFLIGCGIAFFIWLCFFLQIKTTSVKNVKSVYEKVIEKIDDKEKDLFTKQMENGSYEVVTFQNPTTDKYPARFLVGKDFWVYYRFPNCVVVNASDVNKIYLRNDTTNISYNVGNRNIRQNVSLGKSLIISSKTNKEDIVISLGNDEQVKQAKELIKKYKDSSDLFA